MNELKEESKYVDLVGYKVLSVTWNVNSKVDMLENVQTLLFPEGQDKLVEFPDILVVGLQEIVELTPANVIGGVGAEKAAVWHKKFLSALQLKNASYVSVAQNHMVGLWIGLFCLREVLPALSNVQVSSLARGIGGMLGNKGAVYVRMDLEDTSICFVNSHFAAHQDQTKRRNEDFHAIIKHKAFYSYSDILSSGYFNHLSRVERIIKRSKENLLSDLLPPTVVENTKLVLNYSADEHDVVVWLGDLNYRMETELSVDRVVEMISKQESILLIPCDQLTRQKDMGLVFENFNEGLLTFDPTYKFTAGTNNYHMKEGKAQRCPSWCDRILWRTKSNTPNGRVSFNFTRKNEISINEMVKNRNSGKKEVGNGLNNDLLGFGESEKNVSLVSKNVESEKKEVFSFFDEDWSFAPDPPKPSNSPPRPEHIRLSAPKPGSDRNPVEPDFNPPPVVNAIGERPEFRLHEAVALMSYSSSKTNLVSDHKPVRALLNITVKRINWSEVEKYVLKQIHSSLLNREPLDPKETLRAAGCPSAANHIHRSLLTLSTDQNNPVNDNSEKNTNSYPNRRGSANYNYSVNLQTFGSIINQIEDSSGKKSIKSTVCIGGCGGAGGSGRHDIYRVLAVPRCVKLKSQCTKGDRAPLILLNHLTLPPSINNDFGSYSCNLHFKVTEELIPAWLRVKPLFGVISAGSKTTLSVSNKHKPATERLVELMKPEDHASSEKSSNFENKKEIDAHSDELDILAVLEIKFYSVLEPHSPISEKLSESPKNPETSEKPILEPPSQLLIEWPEENNSNKIEDPFAAFSQPINPFDPFSTGFTEKGNQENTETDVFGSFPSNQPDPFNTEFIENQGKKENAEIDIFGTLTEDQGNKVTTEPDIFGSFPSEQPQECLENPIIENQNTNSTLNGENDFDQMLSLESSILVDVVFVPVICTIGNK